MDRVGVGWRPEIAASILCHLDEIEVVEVVVDNLYRLTKAQRRAIKTLKAQVPVHFHSVALGPCSADEVDSDKLKTLAKTLKELGAETWSEHLAFVRSKEIEIGHMAPSPRNEDTIRSTLRNIQLMEQAVGIKPTLENIATLLEPPCSLMTEPEWIGEVLSRSGCGFLLDLHNLYANAVNFGFDPARYLMMFPLDRVCAIHLSGGKYIAEPTQTTAGRTRLLDDHLHDVPIEVFQLLDVAVSQIRSPVDVIIERDGKYPEFSVLLSQVRTAAEIVRKAREKQVKGIQHVDRTI